MNISMRKVLAITEVKGKSLLSKNFIIMPAFTIGMVAVMRAVFTSMGSSNEVDSFMMDYLLNFGLVFNIGLLGIYVTSAALAEEKEKHTLRTLMTSSVNGVEFFIGSITPIFIMMMVINLLLIPVSGCSFVDIPLLMYIFVTSIASLTSCIIGMILGIFAKNQVSANTITTPVLLIFTFIPTFASFMESLEGISKFLFTGVISEMVHAICSHTVFTLTFFQVIVLCGEILVAILVFLYFYKQNGYEKD